MPMKSFLKSFPRANRELAKRPVFLFLDFDGTLSPIAPTPQQAVFPNKTRQIVKTLSHLRNCRVAIISGRGIRDLKSKLKLGNVIYIGNHGLTVRGGGVTFDRITSAQAQRWKQPLIADLRQALKGVKGILFEDKELSLGVHYRKVAGKDSRTIEGQIESLLSSWVKKKGLKIKRGKKVREVMPAVPWNKGKAVNFLLSKFKRVKYLPVYIGDDVTDEDAFRALKGKGITIYVGSKNHKSLAQYHLPNTSSVVSFLRKLAEMRINLLREKYS